MSVVQVQKNQVERQVEVAKTDYLDPTGPVADQARSESTLSRRMKSFPIWPDLQEPNLFRDFRGFVFRFGQISLCET